MGGGAWTTHSYTTYSTSRGRSLDSEGRVTTSYCSAQDMFIQRRTSDMMNPKKFKIRECRDSEEHPNTLPVIIALDVTGSMGSSAIEVAKSLNKIITDVTKEVKDAEFCIMAIGDIAFDCAPVQMSQFESDVRIAEALDSIYFEGGGGTNPYESYTAAWYMAANRTDLDVWKRGGKGVLITLGDEEINPTLNKTSLSSFLSDVPSEESNKITKSLSAKELYDAVKDKYDVHHIHVNHGTASSCRSDDAVKSFSDVIGSDNVKESSINALPQVISDIILRHAREAADHAAGGGSTKVDENGMIDW